MKSLKTAVLLFVALTGWAACGCSENETRKVRVEESQEEGEVRDVPPGEMVVE